jgi:hypothetical protein
MLRDGLSDFLPKEKIEIILVADAGKRIWHSHNNARFITVVDTRKKSRTIRKRGHASAGKATFWVFRKSYRRERRKCHAHWSKE